MRIHREGIKIILGFTVALLVLNLGLYYGLGVGKDAFYLLLTVSLLIFLFVLMFFRNPRRLIIGDDEEQNNLVMSPCDGKVVVIEDVDEPEYFKTKRKQISIFMSPSNVHVNWAPISGKVKYLKYHPGKYLVAWHPKSSTDNERNTVVIATDSAEVLVRQIAGAMARRIVHYMDEGLEVEQGSELGFIKFGSRVDLFLPTDAEILVDIKDKVKGNKTVLARLR